MRTSRIAIGLLAGACLTAAPLVVAARQGVSAPPPVSSGAATPTLEIMARRYVTGGRVGGMAGDHGAESFGSHIWTTSPGLCGLGASDNEPAQLAPHVGWKFSGQVLAHGTGAAADQLSVRIEWERVWEAGARVSGARSGGTQTVMMRVGDVLVLDRVEPTTLGLCDVTEVRLEASVTTRRFPASASGLGGVRRGAGAGRSGGRGQVAPDEVQRLMAAAADALAARARYTVELWLIHRQPDGVERVQQQTLTMGAARTAWAFPPVVVLGERSDERVTLDIAGSLQAAVSAGSTWRPGSEGAVRTVTEVSRLTFAISRQASRAGAVGSDLSGRSEIVMELPDPDEVLSFELPPLHGASAVWLKGHHFSLRLQVKRIVR